MKMANEKKSIIEEALLEAEQIDAAFKSNAKEILSQTMSSEIEEMVKESLTGSKKRLKEEEEEETDLDLDLDTEEGEEEEGAEDMDLELDLDTEEGDEEGSEDIDLELGDEEDMDLDLGDESEEGEMDLDLDMDTDMEPEMDTEIDTVDLTGASDTDVISVFKKMGPEDEIEVVNDNGMVTLKDNKSGSEYRIEMNPTGGVTSVEAGEIGLGEGTEGSEEVIYEIVVDDEDEMSDYMMNEDYMDDDDDCPSGVYHGNQCVDRSGKGESEDSDYMDYMMDEDYMDSEDEMSYMSKTDYIGAAQGEHEGICDQPGYEDHPSCKKDYMKMDYMKKKGLNYTEKYNDNPKLKGKQKTKLPDELQKGIIGSEDEDEMSYMSRTLGAGKRFGRKGLDKPKAAPSHLRVESTTPQITKLIKENTNLNTKLTSIESENTELKDTQEKMVEALKQFRKKLQEVAVFNSNLTYAVRLFTENSTTKEEKQEILKRLDSAKDLKESQSIYKQLVKEFTTSKAPIKESIDEKINKTASSGAQISEQSVFVHPELQNMKKLWEYSYKK